MVYVQREEGGLSMRSFVLNNDAVGFGVPQGNRASLNYCKAQKMQPSMLVDTQKEDDSSDR